MNRLKKKLIRYMDAAFPILYLHTFEEWKAREVIRHTLESTPHIQTVEWNGTDRACDLLSGEMK